MGFHTDEAPYQFTGTKTEQIKQIGNAVSVAKMRIWLPMVEVADDCS
jgi:DNA (cytosine-5)-methyltransferase 1